MVKNSGPSHCWVGLPMTGGSAKAMILKAGWMGKMDLKEEQDLKHNLSRRKLVVVAVARAMTSLGAADVIKAIAQRTSSERTQAILRTYDYSKKGITYGSYVT